MCPPTGSPADIVMSTVDQQRMRQQAKDAEEQARQVMRQYQETTAARLAALPPPPPPPKVVLGGQRGPPGSVRIAQFVAEARNPDGGAVRSPAMSVYDTPSGRYRAIRTITPVTDHLTVTPATSASLADALTRLTPG
jgi:EspG family